MTSPLLKPVASPHVPHPVCNIGPSWSPSSLQLFLDLAWRTIALSWVFSYLVCHSFSVSFVPQPFSIGTPYGCVIVLFFFLSRPTPLVISFSLIVLNIVYMLIIPTFVYLVLTSPFCYRIICNLLFHISNV